MFKKRIVINSNNDLIKFYKRLKYYKYLYFFKFESSNKEIKNIKIPYSVIPNEIITLINTSNNNKILKK